MQALQPDDAYRRWLSEWWERHRTWAAAFPPADLGAAKDARPKAPPTPKKCGIPSPSDEQEPRR